MDWIAQLGGLPLPVAILALFTACVLLVLRAVFNRVVKPFETLVSNHLEHDSEERRAMRDALATHTQELTRLADRLSDKL